MANYRRLPKIYDNNMQMVLIFLSAHADESFSVGQIADAVGKGDRYSSVWKAVEVLKVRDLVILSHIENKIPFYWVNIYALAGGAR
jgi:hypothetical protein